MSAQQQQPYKGLANIGATCYMNSLLQTLFMTREFRNGIYRWRYDQKSDGRKEDSILYQLQKLFARLQTKYPLDVDTRDLAKSFQWGGQEILEQQDIQQFNRVLFDALEQSFRLKSTGLKSDFLSELYEGVMLNFTRCSICGYQHPREQTFQDVLITVKNKYARLYNDSVELGLQRYLKPERLDGNNLYFCEQCQCKVEADRFVKFIKLPKLLGLMLQRFTFDYVTASRQKLNDEVRFPWVLNMNDFMDGYEGIPVKLAEEKEGVEFEQPPPAPERKPLVIKRSTFLKRGKDAKLPNNIKNKPTPATKGFLSEMRKKTGKNNEPTIEVVTREKFTPLTEDQIAQQAIEESLRDMTGEVSEVQASSPASSITTSVKEDLKLQQNQESKTTQEVLPKRFGELPSLPSVPPPLPPPLPPTTAPTGPLLPPPPILEEQENASKLQQQEQLRRKKAQDQKELQEFLGSIKQQVEKYLQQGPMVYELYSILIHSGGPHHGHYYAYIRSSEDGKWYCFNDYKVTELNVQEMLSTVFGGKGGTNAYGLYYRQVDKEVKTHEPIPEEIAKQLEEELAKAQQIKEEKIQNEDKYIKLKLAYQLYVKTVEVMNTMTLKDLLERAKAAFGADHFKDIQPKNMRLRLFNPVNEMKMDTFTGREDRTLELLRIGSHKCLLLETKRQEDTFEEYIAGQQSLRLALWSKDVCSLDESTLKTIKISVDRMLTMRELEQRVIDCLSLSTSICIIKRHQNDEYSYHQIVNTKDYENRTLEDVCLLDNEVIFVEPDTGGELQWPREFQAEVYRVCLKYNLPTKEDSPVFGESIIYDSRAKFGELRQAICDKHGLDPTAVVFKRNSRSGLELKCLTDTLKEYRFITGTQIYLEEGLPAQPGEVRILLHLSQPTDLNCMNSFSTFEQIADIPVNGNLKARQCKELFLKVLKRLRGIEFDPDRIRLRQKLAERMTKIYREKPMREQQLIEKRAIAIERIDFEEQLDPKQNIIYVKLFDPETWTLGPRFEVTVNRSTTMDDLAAMLEQKCPELPATNIELCKITSLYKFNLLDLAQVDYYLLKGIDIPVTSQPLFVNNDGLLYIAKDRNKKLRQLTREEQVKFGGTLKHKQTKTSTYKPPTKKESSVRITVKKQTSTEQKTEASREAVQETLTTEQPKAEGHIPEVSQEHLNESQDACDKRV